MTKREDVAGQELAGIGVLGHPQTTDEASEAEEKRRADEDFSESEKKEAEARDQVAEASPGPEDQGSVPNVGSPSDEGREDGNDDAVAEEGDRFGTDPDEEVTP